MTSGPINNIPPGTLQEFIAGQQGAVVIDVRTAGEWQGGHIPGARHIPVDQLQRRLGELEGVKGQPIIAYCAMGGRSATACQILAAHGFSPVYNAVGGIGSYLGSLAR